MTFVDVRLSAKDWALLLAVLGLQAALYHTVFWRELSWHMPQNFDQAGALFESYDLEHLILTNGIGELWSELWSGRHTNGLLLPVEGAVSGLIFGGGRLARLLVNFAALAGMEVMVFFTVLRMGFRRDLAMAALGLILCQNIPWEDAGGLLDFRLDFMAYCLYGIWACSVLCSGLFRHRRWAVICGVVGAILVLNRFVSIIYIAGVTVGFLGVCLVRSRASACPSSPNKGQIGNAVLSLGIMSVICIPVVLRNWDRIFSYYVIGHVVGDERLFRAHEQGLISLMDHLIYYPHSIVTVHLGLMFGVSVLALGCAALASRQSAVSGDGARGGDPVLASLFLTGAVVGPIVALTMDVSKSPVVGGIVGVPLVLLLAVVIGRIGAAGGRLWTVAAGGVLGLGVMISFAHAFRHLPYYGDRDDLRQMVQLDLDMARTADEYQWARPRISIDRIHPWFFDAAISDTIFEQTGRLMQFRTELSNRVTAISRDEMLTRLRDSDFAVLTSWPKPGLYPFNDGIRANRDLLNQWVSENMRLFRHVRFTDFEADVYIRPSVRVEGIQGGWLLSRGAWVAGAGSMVRSFPVIELEFPLPPPQLPPDTKFTATVDTPSGPRDVPVRWKRGEQELTVSLDLSDMVNLIPDVVTVHVQPDRYFVPSILGINSDSRQLVIRGPTNVRLQRRLGTRGGS